jgi:hypothetical protein
MRATYRAGAGRAVVFRKAKILPVVTPVAQRLRPTTIHNPVTKGSAQSDPAARTMLWVGPEVTPCNAEK